ncbi:MAG: chromate efflux transporter [Rhodospirillales bacterium]|nr:chromate efflux transporter [Rhodospirillales bacterium]
MTDTPAKKEDAVPLGDALKVWLRVAALSFGGPVAQIAVMHRIVVEEKRWIGEERFLHALNYCMLLPGPEATQMAVYLGWLLNRAWGGFLAGFLFVLPGVIVMMILSVFYAGYGEVPVVAAVFYGIKAAVLAIVIEAVIRIGKRALKTDAQIAIAALAFIAIFFLDAPFPLIIIAAGVAGFVGSRAWPTQFAPAAGHGRAAPMPPPVIAEERLYSVEPSARRAVSISVLFAVVWLVPTLAVIWTFGFDNVYARVGVFFSKLAVVTFGGAYAVLAYMAQQAVETYGWVTAGEMMDGLGLAETTPGPLIMVTQFIGFLAAYRDPGMQTPMTAAVLGGLLASWATFAPSFFLIFLGAPYIEALRQNKGLSAALAAITAAVVGVVLNLAAWFAVHAMFASVREVALGPVKMPWPEWASLDPMTAALTVAALIAMLRFKAGMLATLAAAALIGVVWKLGTF